MIVLTVMNLRGVRETVLPLVPIFLVFVLTHIFAIVYAFIATPHPLSEAVNEVQPGFRETWGPAAWAAWCSPCCC